MSGASLDSENPRTCRPGLVPYWWAHLIYAVALLALSLDTFGQGALLPLAYVLLTWAAVFLSPARVRAILVTSVLIVACFHLGAKDLPRRSSPYENCCINLKQIRFALAQYHELYGTFPPAYIADKKGNPRHSWRVLLLPWLEEGALYNNYDFDEPWNGPNNCRLIGQRPAVYACPSNTNCQIGANTYTHYVAVVGSHTVWPGAVGRKLSEISDPTHATVVVVEATGPGIPWTKPQDLTVVEALPILTSVASEQTDGHRMENFLSRQFYGRNVVMADAFTHLVPGGVAPEVWLHMLTIDDGTDLSPEDVAPIIVAPRKVKVGNCIRAGLWIVIVLIPLYWVFPRRARSGEIFPARPPFAADTHRI